MEQKVQLENYQNSETLGGGLGLRWRLALLIVSVPLLLLTPIFVYMGRQYQVSYREAHWDKATIVGRQLAQMITSIAPYVETLDDAPGLGNFLEDMAQNVPEFEFIALVDELGKVIYHSQPALAGEYISELANLSSDEPVIKRDFPEGSLYLISTAIPKPGDEQLSLYIVVGESTQVVAPPLLVVLPALAGILSAVISVTVIQISLNYLILKPLQVLSKGAAIIGGGDLSYTIRMRRTDEFGFVAYSFNEMTRRLQALVLELEERVAMRTSDLQRRTVQLEAVSLVSKEAAKASRDVQLLLDTTVAAISDKFGFYHTGIFVLDDAKEWAILRAASSEGGKRMLARGHRLGVGGVGIVGFVSESGLPRVAFNVGDDAIWFNNPDLPSTHSEMSLPLKIENEVIGVLDVQSEKSEAFTEEDINTLQLMADQLAIALSNARLLEGMEGALDQMRDLQDDYSREGWARIAMRMRPLAYEYDRVDVTPVPMLAVPADMRARQVTHKIVMDGGTPVMMETMKLGERVLGYIGLTAPERVWTQDEIALVESVSEQIAITLESARLFEETRHTARQQTLLNNVLRIAASSSENEQQTLYEISRVLAQGLNMVIGIFTFLFPNFPAVYPRAVVAPNGESIKIFGDTFVLSKEHYIFFRGLNRPELARLIPLLDAIGMQPSDLDASFVDIYDVARVLYVPIRTASHQEGFIAMVQRRDDPPLDPDTRELSQNLANQIGVVLDNLNLASETRQRSEEMQLLYQISLDFSEQNTPRDVLNTVIKRTLSLFEAQNSSLFIYDPDTQELILSLDSGQFIDRLGRRVKVGRDLVGRVFLNRQPEMTNDYRELEDYIPELHDPRFAAVLAIPLGEFGALYIRRSGGSRAAFGERDIRLAGLFAAQAVAAIENAQLTQDAQRRADELAELYDAGIDLSTILDVSQLLNRAAERARQVFDVPAALVLIKDSSSDGYLKGESVDETIHLMPYESSTPRPGGMMEIVLQTRQTRLIHDNREQPGQERLVAAGLLSQMVSPLRIGEDVLGALFVYGTQTKQFKDRDLQLLEFLSTQISSSIQNALQFGRTQSALSVVERQARYQTNVSRAVAALAQDGTKAIPQVLALLGEAADVDRTYYAESIAGPEEDYWRIAADWVIADYPEILEAPELQYLPVEKFPFSLGQLQEVGFVQLPVEQFPPAEREILSAFKLRTMLALAVNMEDQSPGFLGLVSSKDTLLGPDEISALQTVSTALSNTLARENLLTQVQTSLIEQEALYVASAALNTAQTYEDILSILREYTLLGENSHNVSINYFDQPWTLEIRPVWIDVLTRWTELPASVVSQRYAVADFSSADQLFNPVAPETVVIDDVATDARLDDNLRALYLHRFAATSTIFVPLVAGGRWVGYVNAIYSERAAFSEVGLRRLASLAGQAAVAIQNIMQLRTIQARARRERMIRQITEHIQQAPDVESVLQSAVRELGRTFGTSRSVVQFRTPSQEQPENIEDET
ncbi:MAG: GAF domain-containing protein [Anaerolineae bacterium]|nr:GAF domain-containing protein [Anaerolineae bacterium]